MNLNSTEEQGDEVADKVVGEFSIENQANDEINCDSGGNGDSGIENDDELNENRMKILEFYSTPSEVIILSHRK